MIPHGTPEYRGLLILGALLGAPQRDRQADDDAAESQASGDYSVTRTPESAGGE